jgi:zinc transport system permease protein
MLALSINEELAAAEGIDTQRTKTAFIILLALVIAIVMKIVGILLTVAFLIMPAAAARPLARTPEQMVALAAALGSLGVVGGLSLSASFDTQGGPSIVAVLSVLFVLSLAVSHLRRSAR